MGFNKRSPNNIVPGDFEQRIFSELTDNFLIKKHKDYQSHHLRIFFSKQIIQRYETNTKRLYSIISHQSKHFYQSNKKNQ